MKNRIRFRILLLGLYACLWGSVTGSETGKHRIQYIRLGLDLGYLDYAANFNAAAISKTYELDTFSLSPKNNESGGTIGIQFGTAFRMGKKNWYLYPIVNGRKTAVLYEGSMLEEFYYNNDSVVVGRFHEKRYFKLTDWLIDTRLMTGPEFALGPIIHSVTVGLELLIWLRYYDFIDNLNYTGTSRRENYFTLYVPVKYGAVIELRNKVLIEAYGHINVMIVGAKAVKHRSFPYDFESDRNSVSLGRKEGFGGGLRIQLGLQKLLIELNPYVRVVQYKKGEQNTVTISSYGKPFKTYMFFEPDSRQLICGLRIGFEPRFRNTDSKNRLIREEK